MYLNVSKTVEETRKIIDSYYDLRMPTIMEIMEGNTGWFEKCMNFFLIGYAQGRKSTLKELKRNRTK